MATAAQSRTPMHLWIIGGIAALWGAFGGYDYIMTRMRDTEYLAGMMPGVDPNAFLDWIDVFPIWADFGWGLGVWAGQQISEECPSSPSLARRGTRPAPRR